MLKLFMKSGNFEEKKIKDSLILIPKNSTSNQNGCVLQDSSKVIWDYLSKPRNLYEIINHLKEIYIDTTADLQVDVMEFIQSSIELGSVCSCSGVRLELLDEYHSEALAYMLSNDEKLKKALDMNNTTDKNEFFEYTKKWQERTNSNSFSILFDNKVIGLISLSHVKGNSASIGYWLSSKYWNLGLCTRAFKQVINLAKDIELASVGCTIEKDNEISLRIWKRYNADYYLEGDKYIVNLRLEG